MRQNGHGALTLDDARTWIEETGLCLFLPRRQFSTSTAPSFVEAVAGRQSSTPDAKHIALAEDLLVRLETDGIAVRLNLLGQPGEQPDFVVAGWVLPYVYALRGDRDWRRSPQLTGSRAVSPLATQAYKLLEQGDATLADLKHSLGREVTESAVLRAITELWQQLRIIPVVSAPGVSAKWQLLRHRFQKAIAEGASTSQVTAISVLASIYLQAVIAASMEDVELFLAPLTARSKVREVLRGLVATRQVHTISLGHAPHYYVAGTLPEFAVPQTAYTSSSMPAFFLYSREHEDEMPEPEPARILTPPSPVQAITSISAEVRPAPAETHISQSQAAHKASGNGKSPASRPRFNRPAPHNRDRKLSQPSGGNRPARRGASSSRPAARPGSSRPVSSRPASSRSGSARPGSSRPGSSRPGSSRTGSSSRWASSNGRTNGARNGNASHKPAHSHNGSRNGSSGRPANGASAMRNGHANGSKSASAWTKRNGHSNGSKAAGKPASANRSASLSRSGATARKESRPGRGKGNKPALTAEAKGGNVKRYGFTARNGGSGKKRG